MASLSTTLYYERTRILRTYPNTTNVPDQSLVHSTDWALSPRDPSHR